jgi:hypothetical protein
MPLFHRAIEFALMLGLLASVAYWGWQTGGDGAGQWMLAGGAAAVIGIIWIAIRFGGDRGTSPIAVLRSGRVRLAAELVVIGIAATAVWTAGSRAASETLLTAFAIHYALTWDRVMRLVRPAELESRGGT